MAVLGCLTKLERGLRLASGAHFLHDFPIECSLFNTLSIDILRFIFNQPLKQWLIGRKRGEDGKTKI